MREVIDRVHKDVISRFIWTPDLEVFGRVEHWDRPILREGQLYGDCDDFALECLYRLLDVGIESYMAVCRTEVGQRANKPGINHAVLLVVSDKIWVLDNRQRRPELIQFLGYDHWAKPVDPRNIGGNWEKFTVEV